jgi:hypothetical protein
MSASQIAFWIITGIFLPLGLYLIFSRSDRDWVWGPILTVIGVVALIFAIRGLLREESHPEVPKPDVTLRFIYPEYPAPEFLNLSPTTARQVRYQVTLFNLDILSEHTDPLPIPTQAIDWIGPNSKIGPEDLFSTPLVKPLLQSGNRLIGSVGVSCPDCARGHTFIVYIEWGKGGWFTELSDISDGSVLIPHRFTRVEILGYSNSLLARIPQNARTPIIKR